jgi:hypothetical protein
MPGKRYVGQTANWNSTVIHVPIMVYFTNLWHLDCADILNHYHIGSLPNMVVINGIPFIKTSSMMDETIIVSSTTFSLIMKLRHPVLRRQM